MSEVDFLPDWYRSIKRRKCVLKLQGWALLSLIVIGGIVLAAQQRDIQLARQRLTNLHGRLDNTAAQQRLLDEQISLRKQLQGRKSVLATIGEPVDASRLLTTLESLTPREMSLNEFNCSLEEAARSGNVVRLGDASDRAINRRLKVRIVGVAPSDLDLANFLAAMTNVPLFQNVVPNYSTPKTDSGHILREFEISFWIDLNPSSNGEVTWAN